MGGVASSHEELASLADAEQSRLSPAERWRACFEVTRMAWPQRESPAGGGVGFRFYGVRPWVKK